GILAVLAVHAVLTIRADQAFYEKSLDDNSHSKGTLLAKAIARILRSGEGQVRALQMIDEANEPNGRERYRWVWLNAPEDDPRAPRAPRSVLGPVALGREVPYSDTNAQGEPVRRTYVPASIERGRPGAVEVTASMAPQREHAAATLRNTLVTT